MPAIGTKQPRAQGHGDMKTMTFGEHLEELRRRLMFSVIAIVVAMLVFMVNKGLVNRVVTGPYHRTWLMAFEDFYARDVGARDLSGIHDETEREREAARIAWWEEQRPRILRGRFPTDAEMAARGFPIPRALISVTPLADIFVWMGVSVLLALVVAAPVVLYQMWKFIAAGLYQNERRVALRYFPLSLGLFAAGVGFGYYVMVPYGLRFLIVLMDTSYVLPLFNVRDYFSFLFALTAALGLIFQLPLVMMALVKVGICTPGLYTRYWRHAVVAMFAASMFLTPPDPVTQVLMALPMSALYGLGILLARSAAPVAPAAPEAPGATEGEGAT